MTTFLVSFTTVFYWQETALLTLCGRRRIAFASRSSWASLGRHGQPSRWTSGRFRPHRAFGLGFGQCGGPFPNNKSITTGPLRTVCGNIRAPAVPPPGRCAVARPGGVRWPPASNSRRAGRSPRRSPAAKEFAMLRLLLETPGESVSRDRFLHVVWGYTAFPTTRTVDKHIASLCSKIEEDPDQPRWIQTVHAIEDAAASRNLAAPSSASLLPATSAPGTGGDLRETIPGVLGVPSSGQVQPSAPAARAGRAEPGAAPQPRMVPARTLGSRFSALAEKKAQLQLDKVELVPSRQATKAALKAGWAAMSRSARRNKVLPGSTRCQGDAPEGCGSGIKSKRRPR